MSDLNAPLDGNERDAQAWRMLEERLFMMGADLTRLKIGNATLVDVMAVLSAVHDTLAYRRQS